MPKTKKKNATVHFDAERYPRDMYLTGMYYHFEDEDEDLAEYGSWFILE